MNTLIELADAYSEASFEQGLNKSRAYPEKARAALVAGIEALQAEVENLKRDVACHDDMSNEIAFLRAELDALKSQEPVGVVAIAPHQATTVGWYPNAPIKHNDKLYTAAGAAPQAPAPLTDEQMGKLYRQSALQDRIVVRSDWEQGVRDGEKAHGITEAQG